MNIPLPLFLGGGQIYDSELVQPFDPFRSNTHNLNILEFHENWDYDGFVQILTWSLISILWFSPKTASN